MSKAKTPCQCPLAGWCPAHRRKMSAVRHQQCQQEPGYFEAFQRGKEQRKQRGLGDSIAEITHKTGIAKALHALAEKTGKDCGCPERQGWLNEKVPYK